MSQETYNKDSLKNLVKISPPDKPKSLVSLTVTITSEQKELLRSGSQNSSYYARQAIEAYYSDNNWRSLLSEEIKARVEGMPDKAQYIAEAVKLLIDLPIEVLSALNAMEDKSAILNLAIALLKN